MRIRHPSIVKGYVFFKLTVDCILRHTNLRNRKKFFLADLAKRVFVHHSVNDSLILMRAVEHLIYQSDIDSMWELENASWKQMRNKIGLGDVSFLKERVIRILRIN
jgi:hypothetical protein